MNKLFCGALIAALAWVFFLRINTYIMRFNTLFIIGIPMFFQKKRHKKIVRAIWTVLVILIIISMVLLYTPIF